VTEGRFRRRNGGKETKGKSQRGGIEGEKSDVRDMGHIDTGRDTEWWRDKRGRWRKGETVGEKGEETGDKVETEG
jgi:hypothetical protein